MYRLASDDLQARMAEMSTGSTVPHLNMADIRAFPVSPLPPPSAQGRIAAVLSAFDELIEINERRIELLEDFARSLYREWFVYFRFPGHEDVEFVDSELDKIPEGWCVSRINNVTSNISRGIAPKYADDGRWMVLNQRCIRNQRVTFSLTRRHEGSVSDVKQLKFGDVLINSTGVGTLGRVGMLLEETRRTTVDSHVTIVRPASPDLHPWFGLHLLCREPAFQAMGTGSTGQTELGRAAVGELPILVPPIAVLRAFGDVAWPLLRPMSTLLRCCDLLAATRDLLLPRLVSGKLDISDIDLGVLTPAEAE
jgi:type I restriction enzyme S subunit